MRLEVRQPILSNVDLEKIRHIDDQNGPFKSETLSICYPISDGTAGMKFALDLLCKTAQEKVLEGNNILILSDRAVDLSAVATAERSTALSDKMSMLFPSSTFS